jgi:uncharacterized protein with FMN-binding domain
MSKIALATVAFVASSTAAASIAFAQALPPGSAAETPAPGSGTAPTQPAGAYRDGSYTGRRYDAFWGKVQLRVVVANGMIAAVQVLDYPHDRQTSREINGNALPVLEREVVQAQGVRVHAVTGATVTTMAYLNSLSSALQQAQ